MACGRVHEARGLDVNPQTIKKFAKAGDTASVEKLEIIHSVSTLFCQPFLANYMNVTVYKLQDEITHGEAFVA